MGVSSQTFHEMGRRGNERDHEKGDFSAGNVRDAWWGVTAISPRGGRGSNLFETQPGGGGTFLPSISCRYQGLSGMANRGALRNAEGSAQLIVERTVRREKECKKGISGSNQATVKRGRCGAGDEKRTVVRPRKTAYQRVHRRKGVYEAGDCETSVKSQAGNTDGEVKKRTYGRKVEGKLERKLGKTTLFIVTKLPKTKMKFPTVK